MSKKIDAASKLSEYKDDISKRLDTLLKETFPKKVLELNDILSSDKFSFKQLKLIHDGPDVEPLLPPTSAEDSAATRNVDVKDITNRFMTWNLLSIALPPGGRVQCNKHVLELYDLTKLLQFELIQHTEMAKSAIGFLTPKVEDGNNFGVEIQEETVKMITEVEKARDDKWKDFSFRNYFKDRASFGSQLCREPHLDDHKEGLRQLDEDAFLFLIEITRFIRDSYAKMHDVINKNIEKIKIPRTSNAGDLF